MTRDEFEAGILRAAEIQREAGWSEASIDSYAVEMRVLTGDNYGCMLVVGAGLAQDNSRHGVVRPHFEWAQEPARRGRRQQRAT